MILRNYLKPYMKKNCIQRLKHSWIQPEGHDTNIKVYNCITKSKVPLIIRNKDQVSWYTCGPTVYDSAHIGHASCYVKLDILQRILRHHFKLNLITVMNITDIDDKIIKKSAQLKVSSAEIARKFENEFWSDLQKLNVMKPDIVVRVTEHIPLIISLIKQLLIDNKAYIASDGSIYFDISKCGDLYGKLVPTLESEIDTNGIKKTSADFVLWKSAKHGEPSWKSEFGFGRPGWHTECSALASAIFGKCIDFHAGGIDLRFPHHENEEAISCAGHQTNQWVNYWLHTGYLNLSGDTSKMSKSLGNTVSIQDILKGDEITADIFRMACVMSHYRANMDYSQELISTADDQLNKIKLFLNECDVCTSQINQTVDLNILELIPRMNKATNEINAALLDDFNTAKVIRTITELTTMCNKIIHAPSTTNILNFSDDSVKPSVVVASLANFVREQLKLLGFSPTLTKKNNLDTNENSDGNILDVLVAFRQNIRNIGVQNKDSDLLKYCDALRDELKMYGVQITDRGKNSSWNKS